MKNLKYRIYSVSSQSKQYPASNLLNSEQGWQSQVNCKYPQQLTIQFYLPIRIKCLKITFHQYKISKMIQIFIKTVKNQKFRKLGYIKPQENIQSQFENKQIKTIFFEFPCSFIRLILHQNYRNQYNLFDQIAISNIIVQGQVLNPVQLRNLDLTEIQTQQSEDGQKQKRVEILEAAINIQNKQSIFSQLIKILEKKKIQSVQSQQYQKAQNFKNLILKYKNIEAEVMSLQKQKKKAISCQDFDKCHQLKIQINLKNQMAISQLNKLQQIQSNYQSRVSNNLNYQQINNLTPLEYRSPIKIDDYQSQIVPALRNKKKTQQMGFEINNTNKISQYPESQQKDISRQIQEETSKKQSEPLQQKLLLRLQKYFPIISQQIWKKVVQKSWKIKYQALTQIFNIKIDNRQKFMAILELVSFTIQDSHPNVITSSLFLLKNLIASKIDVTVQHLPFFVETIIQSLINMLNDTNARIKQIAFSVYLTLPDLTLLPLGLVIGHLIRHKQKVKSDPRLSCVKIGLMIALIEQYSDSSYHFDEILNWGVAYIEDANSDVRSNASDLLLILSFRMGNQKIVNALKNVRPNVLNSFLMLLNASMQASKLQRSRDDQSQQQTRKFKQNSSKLSLEKMKEDQDSDPYRIQDHEDVDLAYSQQSLFNKTQKSQQPWIEKAHTDRSNEDEIRVMEDNLKQCDYCFQQILDENLTKHLKYKCCALVDCQSCEGRIYLRQMSYHLLKECPDSQYQQCRRCGLVFEISQINHHTAIDSCIPRRKNKQRCQFCSQDIENNDYAWVLHSKICKNLPTTRLQQQQYGIN